MTSAMIIVTTVVFSSWQRATAISIVSVVRVNASDTPNHRDRTVTIAWRNANNRMTATPLPSDFIG